MCLLLFWLVLSKEGNDPMSHPLLFVLIVIDIFLHAWVVIVSVWYCVGSQRVRGC